MGDNADEWIKIYWDVPWISGAPNRVKTETFNEDVSAEVEGLAGHGTVGDVTIKIVDGRG
ncbi:aegerolysin family protein [Streptomyces sp. NPDC058335]|uniref:aegerolysin family protein n=1 Tax=Streptomyces sp. NPDC058335 TaxID=3346451 RepID=UPI00365ECD06